VEKQEIQVLLAENEGLKGWRGDVVHVFDSELPGGVGLLSGNNH
jgi:hypothetical protein